MNFEAERTDAIEKNKVAWPDKIFLNDSLNRKVDILKALKGSADRITACLKRYQVRARGTDLFIRVG